MRTISEQDCPLCGGDRYYDLYEKKEYRTHNATLILNCKGVDCKIKSMSNRIPNHMDDFSGEMTTKGRLVSRWKSKSKKIKGVYYAV